MENEDYTSVRESTEVRNNGGVQIKEGSYINGAGVNVTTKTPKVTGKGQQYFINKFLAV